MRKLSLVVLSLSLFATACGGGGGSGPVIFDARPRTDAAPTCMADTAGYGDVGTLNMGDATVGPQMQTPTQDWISLAMALNGDTNPDVLFITLWEGFGAIPGDFASLTLPLTVTIAGVETSFATCGTCVELTGDFVSGVGGQGYMAQSGTIVIDSLDATPGTGRITGSISSVNFEEVDDMGMLVPGGCASSISAMMFDLPIVMRQ